MNGMNPVDAVPQSRVSLSIYCKGLQNKDSFLSRARFALCKRKLRTDCGGIELGLENTEFMEEDCPASPVFRSKTETRYSHSLACVFIANNKRLNNNPAPTESHKCCGKYYELLTNSQGPPWVTSPWARPHGHETGSGHITSPPASNEGEGDGEGGDVVHSRGAIYAEEEGEGVRGEDERNALAVGGDDEVCLEKVCSLEDPRQDAQTRTFTLQGNARHSEARIQVTLTAREYKAHSIPMTYKTHSRSALQDTGGSVWEFHFLFNL